MRDKSIAKVMSVWQVGNEILDPSNIKINLDFVEQIATLFSAGLYYYYILNFAKIEMEFVNNGVKDVLGIEPRDFSLNKILQLMHPDDISKLYEKEETVKHFLLNELPTEDMTSYKVVYLFRLRDINGSYKTILQQSKVLTVSEHGKIEQVIGIHTDVTHLNIPIDHKISFISNNKPSYCSIKAGLPINLQRIHYKDNFTTREIEVINKLSEGKNFKEVASDLYVSPHTINTHKKNILQKSGCKNTAELMTKCIREGVI